MIKQSAEIQNTEILGVADTVAREKGIDREEVINALETAIQKASRAKYGLERNIRAHIDRKTGSISLMAHLIIVEDVQNDATEISLEDALRVDPNAILGGEIVQPLPPMDFGRVAAQTAKQIIFQKVRDAERQKQYMEFKDRLGELISGQVKRVEFGNVIVEIGRAEGFLPRDQLLPKENFKPGDRIRCYIMDVKEELRGPQIFLSRTHSQFMAKLFAQEVPEIYDGLIEVKAVARDPGSRAKIAVTSGDRSIDPVGACVGLRGSRVQAVINELQGEKIDIIPWSANPAIFVVNALIPAEATKVVLDEETHRVEVIVPDDQLSLAIGRRGQNVRLASELTGWHIDIMSESEESNKRTTETKMRSGLFVEALDVDDVLAHLLVSEGFTSVEEIVLVPLEELVAIEGFEKELAEELKKRASNYLEQKNKEYQEKFKELNIDQSLSSLEGLKPEMIITLSKSDIKNIEDFANLAGDELREILPELSKESANQMIMNARAHWFEQEK
jgi:N utilization substance protein A